LTLLEVFILATMTHQVLEQYNSLPLAYNTNHKQATAKPLGNYLTSTYWWWLL